MVGGLVTSFEHSDDTDLSQLSIGSVTAVYPDGTEVSLTEQTVDIYEFDQTFTGDFAPYFTKI